MARTGAGNALAFSRMVWMSSTRLGRTITRGRVTTVPSQLRRTATLAAMYPPVDSPKTTRVALIGWQGTPTGTPGRIRCKRGVTKGRRQIGRGDEALAAARWQPRYRR